MILFYYTVTFLHQIIIYCYYFLVNFEETVILMLTIRNYWFMLNSGNFIVNWDNDIIKHPYDVYKPCSIKLNIVLNDLFQK